MGGCAAPNCRGNTAKGDRMFSFPKDPVRRQKWCENSGRLNPAPKSLLCEAHFDENQFERNRQDGWKKLKPNAIPTIFPKPEEFKQNTSKNTKSKGSKKKKQPLKVLMKKKQTQKKSRNITEVKSEVMEKNEVEKSKQRNKRKRRIPMKKYDDNEYEVEWPLKKSKMATKAPPATKNQRGNTTAKKKIQENTPPRTKESQAIAMCSTRTPQIIIPKAPLHSVMLNYAVPGIPPREEHPYAKKSKTKPAEEKPPVELVEIYFNNEMEEEGLDAEFNCRNCVKLTAEVSTLQSENRELRRKLSCLHSAIKIFLNPGQRETLKAVAKSFKIDPSDPIEEL